MKRKANKLLSVALCLVLIFTLGVIWASADELTGSGTSADPYLISTADDIAALSDAVNNGNDFSGCIVTLTDDITFSGNFTPIGNPSAPFRGTFLGEGHTVSGLHVNTAYAGFFGYTENAVISELRVNGTFDITGGDYAGAIVAYAVNTDITDCTGGASVYADNYSGGIVGYISSGTVSDTKTLSSATVGCDNENCGGIAGYSAADIIGCTNNSYIFANKNVGGIAGVSKGDIISCTNTVKIDAYSSNYGGIAGIAEGTVKFCKNSGTVSGSTRNEGKAGGIAGIANKAEISQCLQAGNVISAGEYAGGIAGYVTDGSITDCICTGNVTTTMNFAGGIFGSATKTQVARCLFTASVSAASATDGAIGAVSSAAVSGCYYNSDNEAKAFVSAVSSEGVTGITTNAISSRNSYQGWDFENTWTVNSLHAQHPLLKGIPFHSIANISYQAPDCTEDGIIIDSCSVCNEIIETVLKAEGHDFTPVSYRYASCSLDGYIDSICTKCNETDTEILPATDHLDENKDNHCDSCNMELGSDKDEEKSIFEKIIDFFASIIEWLRNLFK